MNISPVAQANPVKLASNTNFGSNYRTNTIDSFEKSSKAEDVETSYPISVKYNPVFRRRNKSINSANKVVQNQLAKKVAEQKVIKAEFVELHSEIKNVLTEIIDLTSNESFGLQKLKKLIVDEADEQIKNHYLEIYTKKAQKVKELITEYEDLQQKMQEFYESGKAKFTNIPDIAINLSPENIEYYKELT